MHEARPAPDERALRWVIDQVDRSATIVDVRPLHGGTSSLLDAVSLRTRGGHRATMSMFDSEAPDSPADRGGTCRVVLRRFDNRAWLAEEPDLAAHEAASLEHVACAGLAAPRIVAADVDGSACGMPATLMSWIDGSVVLRPRDRARWIDALAAELARIHAVDADGFAWEYYTYADVARLDVPSWSGVPDAWARALAIVSGPRPAAPTCFIHRDYHPANVLFDGDHVSGVVDWVSSCRGPGAIDVGHCRVNLALLCGIDAADAFLDAYRRNAAEGFVYDPYWDLLSMADFVEGPPTVWSGWIALGVTDLDDALMLRRIDAYVASLVARTG